MTVNKSGMLLQQFKDLATGYLKKDLNRAFDYLESQILKNSRIIKDLILLRSQLKDLDKTFGAGLITSDEYLKTKNLIRKELIRVIYRIRESELAGQFDRAYFLTILEENKRSLEFPLVVGSKHTIGRNADRDIVINDPMVSRSHCLLTVNRDAFYIEDFNSRLGIFLNGEKIKAAFFKVGDQVKIGNSLLVIEDKDPTLEV